MDDVLEVRRRPGDPLQAGRRTRKRAVGSLRDRRLAVLNATASDVMSYDLLRNILFPVTSPARQAAASAGFKLTGFKLLNDSTLTPGQGVHGVREVFAYTYPGSITDIFDQVALTNANSTIAYVLIVHCVSSCYEQNFDVINTVMTSFTVRSQ